MSKETTTVTVFDREEYDGSDWPHHDALAFLGWFQGKVDTIPAEYRDTATINVGSKSGYEGDHSVHIVISYTRPATNAEIKERAAYQRQRESMEEQRERAAYQLLKAKYGS